MIIYIIYWIQRDKFPWCLISLPIILDDTLYYFLFSKASIILFLFISVDQENIKSPVMEGLDALVAVCNAFLSLCLYQLNHIIAVDSFSWCFLFFFPQETKSLMINAQPDVLG